MKPHLFLSIAVFCLMGQKLSAQKTGLRTQSNFNAEWQYLEDAVKDVKIVSGAQGWEAIGLPHTWNNLDATDNETGYRRSGSWYRKELFLDKVDGNKRYQLYFEGANITTEVYVNQELAGTHIGGYIGFEIDMTPHLKKGSNLIHIRVDNGYDPDIIPSQKSDFFIYGGIVRDVWLQIKPKVAIGHLKLATPSVSQERASLQVTVPLTEAVGRDHQLSVELIDSAGEVVRTKTTRVRGTLNVIDIKGIANPQLWDTADPNLYDVKVTLLRSGTPVDQVSERVGFRWFKFEKNGPFYLNGKRVLLRGTHRHEEHAGVGAAMSNDQHRKDIEQIKEIGANFLRLAHYPQDPEVYRACDELGILVWDELPWCRGGMGGEVWQANTKRMLGEMIDQNYNHPSIIIWSLGNEMYWLPDFEGGDDTTKMNAFLTELNALAHEMDPSRKTAIRKYYEGADIVDVFSPSIWSGWYSGSYKSYQKAIDTYKPKYNHFLHTEYGGSSHVGRHSENPITGEGIIKSEGWEEAIVQTKVANIAQIGDWSESYIVDLFDWYLRISEQDSTFVGNAQWAFKDFGTPLRPENDIPYMNQKGLVDRNGKPKDAYYVFKSYWSKDPFVYIESKTWTERQGPKDKQRSINVFSNCDEVHLTLNGTDLGKRKRDITKFPASGLVWDLDFEEGENELIATGHTDRGVVQDTLRVNYRHQRNGSAKALELEYEPLDNGRYLVTAIAVDANGLRCLDYEDKVYFQTLEGGKSLKHQGTPTGSEVIGMANGKASIEVIPDDTDAAVKVMVLNQNFKGTYLTIKKK
ncbi:glycoside hydrolase family 2 protein [Maribacter sp. 2307ULW6-5]|uniref:glycoside hydrolase family 2 protein n=1 Tax=Maribacter sp. 2307ULW6-5 TaxID=3386275 RepID=UPI0039BC2746